MKDILRDKDFERAATELRCSVAAIRAVTAIEAPRGPWLPGDPEERTPILFEGHLMWRYASKLPGFADFAHKYPTIVFPQWIRGVTTKYYKGGAAEYDRLAVASRFDEASALKACSWGMFQILGVNFSICGFNSVQEFVAAMQASAGSQLDAFIEYVQHTSLDDELREMRWADFARKYNGPGQVKDYAGRLLRRYTELSGK